MKDIWRKLSNDILKSSWMKVCGKNLLVVDEEVVPMEQDLWTRTVLVHWILAAGRVKRAFLFHPEKKNLFWLSSRPRESPPPNDCMRIFYTFITFCKSDWSTENKIFIVILRNSLWDAWALKLNCSPMCCFKKEVNKLTSSVLRDSGIVCSVGGL